MKATEEALADLQNKSQKGGDQKFKPGRPSADFESPNWLKGFIDDAQKVDIAQLSTAYHTAGSCIPTFVQHSPFSKA